MADFLQQLYSALGGMQQPPTQPGVGGQQQAAAPAAQPGVMDFLSTPIAQGALGAYLGYLSRPRGLNTSPWQGVGLGGLTGLGAMQQARQQQLEMPLRQTEIQTKQAELGIEKTKAQQATEQYQARKAMLDQFDQDPTMQQLQKTNPLVHLAARNGILEGKLSLKDLGMEPMTPFEKGRLDILKTTAESEAKHRTVEEEQRAQQLGQEAAYQRGELGLRGEGLGIEAGRLGLERGRLGLEESQVGARQKLIDAQTALVNARRQALAGTDITPKELDSIEKQAMGNAVKLAGPAPKVEAPGAFESVTGTVGREQQANADYQAKLQTLKAAEYSRLLAERQGLRGKAVSASAPATGEEDPLSLIPSGASPAIGSDGSHGYVDSSGFHSLEE